VAAIGKRRHSPTDRPGAADDVAVARSRRCASTTRTTSSGFNGVILAGGELLRRRQSAEAKFAFLLATPIMAAGVLKLPTLAGPAGQGILGQVLVGAIVAAVAAYLSVRFLTRYFHSQTLLPFAA
jgi:hypothetical protein